MVEHPPFRPLGNRRAGSALPVMLLMIGCGVTDVPAPVHQAGEAAFALISDTIALRSPTSPFSGSPAYVSLLPGTFPTATTILIRNERTGEQLEVPLENGGLDPVPVTAQAGDRILLTVTSAGGGVTTFARAVPARRRPRVVRVNPPRGRTDVAINASVVVVFSEPVDPATVTSVTLRLESEGGIAVDGTVRVSDDGLSAIYIPSARLAPGTVYRIAVSGDVRDRDGSPIETPPEATFRTRGVPTEPTPLPGALSSNAIAFRNFFGGIMLIAPDGSVSASIFGTTATDAEPAWSPDGTRIVLARQGKGSEPELFVLATAADNPAVALSQPGDEPAWSPDGRRIAFTSRRSGNSEIYVMNANGTGLMQITHEAADDLSPAWSPDGSRIAFVRASAGVQGKLLVMQPDGTGAVSLGQEGSGPAWSPDGTRIAFAKLVTDPWRQDIYVMRADGTGAVPLTRNPTNAMSNGPTWSPDGTRIAFAHTPDADALPDQIYVIDADGTGMEHIGPDQPGRGLMSASFAPAWSPR